MESSRLNIVKQNRINAENEISLIKEQEVIEKSLFNLHLRRAILYKFQLDPEEVDTDSFAEIVEKSLEKSMQISKEAAVDIEKSADCVGATSGMMKKALLFMSLQKMFQVKVDVAQTGKCKTLSQVCELVWKAVEMSEQWKTKE